MEDEQCLTPKKIFTCHNKHCANFNPSFMHCAQTENTKGNSNYCHCVLGRKWGKPLTKSNCVTNKRTKTDRALSVRTNPRIT